MKPARKCWWRILNLAPIMADNVIADGYERDHEWVERVPDHGMLRQPDRQVELAQRARVAAHGDAAHHRGFSFAERFDDPNQVVGEAKDLAEGMCGGAVLG
jgi:hypothetical protein